MSELYKFSPFSHKFDLGDGHIALFHSLDFELIFMRNSDYEKVRRNIKSGSSTALEYYPILKRNNFVVCDLDYEWKRYFNLRRTLLGEPRINMLYLLLTTDCNFRCNYCYVDKSMASYMSESVVSHAIESFISSYVGNDDELLIIFYGGEPLLNFNVLTQSVKYAKQVCRMFNKKTELLNFQLITNGSLLNTKIVNFLADENVSVAVSLDGPKSINDIARKYRTGRSSFDDTLKGIELIKKKDMSFSISCTIGKHNLFSLPEVFKWFYEKIGTSEIGFNIIQGKNSNQINEHLLSQIADQIINCFKISRNFNIYEQKIMRTVNAFVNKEVYPVDCGGCGRQLVITPDATYGPCPGFIGNNTYFKQLPIKDINKDQVFIEWSNRSPLKIDACVKCEALGICGGGCPYHAYINSGSIWELDKRHCTYIKNLLKWLVFDTYYQIKNQGH